MNFDWDDLDLPRDLPDADPPVSLHHAGGSVQGHHEPNEQLGDAAGSSSPEWTWKCLACDSASCAWSFGEWVCSACGKKEFYQTNKPAKKLTQEGTWMFMPFSAATQEVPTGPGRSRRRRRQRRGFDPEPDGSHRAETAESENLTNDPIVDPELPPPPQRQDSRVLPQHQGQGQSRALPPGRGAQGGGSGTASSSEDKLLSALRRLVSTKKEDDWSAAAGPERGVRWRGGQIPQPPLWKYDRDDVRAYSKFVKKVSIWQLQASPYVSPKEMSLLLYNSLQGEAEQELEHTAIEDIHHEDGVQVILQALKAPMEQKIVYQKRRFLHEFEVLRRFGGETMRAYVNRFRRSQRLLKSVGIDITHTYDSESLGARLLDRSGLSQEAQRLLLVGTNQKLEFELLSEAMLLQYPDFRGAPPVLGRDGVPHQGKGHHKGSKGSRSTTASSSSGSSQSSSMFSSKGNAGPRQQVHYTEVADADQPEGEADEFLDPIDEEGDEADDNDQDGAGDGDDDELWPDNDGDGDVDVAAIADVLTLTAKKLSNLTLGRKFTGRIKTKGSGKGRGTGQQDDGKKANTHCAACGQRGHWWKDPECPANAGKGAPSKPFEKNKQPVGSKGTSSKSHHVGIIHHEFGEVDIQPASSDYGNMFSVKMVQHVHRAPHDVCEVSVSGPQDFAGYLVLDTGCQRMCCGQEWFQAHVERLREFDLHPKMVHFPDSFQFGKGAPTHASMKMYTPACIAGVPLLLGASVLPETVPLLASNSLLTSLGAIFNLVTDTIIFGNLNGACAKIHRIGGHMALNILDFLSDEDVSKWSVWKEFSNPELWTSPHPECLLSDQTSSLGQQALLAKLSDAPVSSVMVGSMAPCGPSVEELSQEADLPDAHGNPPGHDSSGGSSCIASGDPSSSHSVNLYPQQLQEVRKPTRKIRGMPSVPHPMEVESREGDVGPSWVKRSLYALAAFATTFLGNNLNDAAIPEGNLPGKTFRAQESSYDSNLDSNNQREWSLDGLLQDTPSFGSLVPNELPGGLQRDGTGRPFRSTTKELGGTRFLQRGSVQGGEDETSEGGRREALDPPLGVGSDHHRGGRALRLGVSGGHSMNLKKGTAKKLRGDWLRSSRLLQAEHEVYGNIRSVADRPPPNADLWELFAGKGLPTQLAHEYGLVALQPLDLLHGDDLSQPSVQRRVLKTLDSLRPWLTILGLK